MGIMIGGNANGVQEATSGNIRAERTPSGNITIATVEHAGDTLRDLDLGPVEIRRADLDDAIAALQALRGDAGGSVSYECPTHGRFEAGASRGTEIPCPRCRIYSPVVVPPAVIAAAERNPDLVRKIEENNERLMTSLKERMPPPPGFEAVLDSYYPRDPETGERTLPGRHRTPPPDCATIKKSPDSSGFVYPIAEPPLDTFAALGRKMEAAAAEGAQQPNHTFRAITGKEPAAETCAKCGHHRVFHQIGTGHGVSRGRQFCDDRHAPPCGCDGFTPVTTPPAVLLPGQSFALVGRWRVYFNKHGRADLPWCVAPEGGGWELAVPAVLIATEAETTHQPKATPDDEDGRPSAWIAVEGKLVVANDAGRASITAIAEPEIQTP